MYFMVLFSFELTIISVLSLFRCIVVSVFVLQAVALQTNQYTIHMYLVFWLFPSHRGQILCTLGSLRSDRGWTWPEIWFKENIVFLSVLIQPEIPS